MAANIHFDRQNQNSPQSRFVPKNNYAEKTYPNCILCEDNKQNAYHSISKCNRFKQAREKLDRLKHLGYCTVHTMSEKRTLC